MPRKHKSKPDYTYRESFPLDSSGSYIVAYSGGADSCALMAMALEVTGDPKRVHPFMMSLLPGKLDYYQYWKEICPGTMGSDRDRSRALVAFLV